MKDKFYNIFKIISEYALYGLLFFIPISISLVEIFAGLLLLGFIGCKVIKPDFKFIKFWPNVLLLLFWFFCALSLLNSGQHLHKSIHALFGKWAQYLGICIIIQGSIHDRKIIKRSVFVFLSSAALVILSGLSQYYFGVEFLRNKSMVIMDCSTRAVTSCFVHYNSFGAYLVVVLSLVGGLLLADNRGLLKTISLLTLSMLSTVAVILTFSRGSWVGLVISFVFMSVFAKKRFKWLIPVFFVFTVMFFFPVIHERLYLIFKSGGDSRRFIYWTGALKMIKEHPFLGMGIGTFMVNVKNYWPISDVLMYAHNCFLQIWAESGIFSLISFILFINAVIILGIKSFFGSRDFLLLGLLSGAIGYLGHSFFDTNLYSLQLAFLFWIWVGLIVAVQRIALKSRGSPLY